jgi:hypothetical protein
MHESEKIPIKSRIEDFSSKYLLSIIIFFFVAGVFLILIPFFDGSYYWYYTNYGEESQKIRWYLGSSSGGIRVLSGIILLVINSFLVYVKLRSK